jgi:hypothetical protein
VVKRGVNGSEPMKSEKPSGVEDGGTGGLSVVVNENDIAVPIGLNGTCSSLRKEPPVSENNHGPVPVTFPPGGMVAEP